MHLMLRNPNNLESVGHMWNHFMDFAQKEKIYINFIIKVVNIFFN